MELLLLAILLIAAGVLAAASLIVAKQPNAQEAINKLVPYQGIIGIILLLWGLFVLLFRLLSVLGLLLQYAPLTGIGMLLACLVAIALGILLGYGLISKYALSKNADAARSGEMVRTKLVGIQVPLGIAGIVTGIWALLIYVNFSRF
jgi:glucan phosphoethanolaminetransferase (alkaline phosphatase superfamily)